MRARPRFRFSTLSKDSNWRLHGRTYSSPQSKVRSLSTRSYSVLPTEASAWSRAFLHPPASKLPSPGKTHSPPPGKPHAGFRAPEDGTVAIYINDVLTARLDTCFPMPAQPPRAHASSHLESLRGIPRRLDSALPPPAPPSRSRPISRRARCCVVTCH